MLTALKKINHKHVTFLINILVAVFFVTILTFKKGYSYVPMILGISSLVYLGIYGVKSRAGFAFDKDDKRLIWAFLAYFITFVISTVVHGDGLREIDNPSRVLLFLPLILLFAQFPLNVKIVFYAIPIGSAVSGLLAAYQKFALGLSKPFPDTMHIQSGNVAITLATLSLAIAVYWGIKKELRLALFCLIGALLGMFASALTGARGGWVGFPFVMATMLLCYRRYLNKRFILLIVGIFATFITLVALNPKTDVMQRFHVAKSDIEKYLEHGEENTSLGARFDMWENAVLAIREKPVLGWGSNGYQALKKAQVDSKTMSSSTLVFNDTHNQYLESWVKRGIIGFFGLLLVLIIPLKYFLTVVKSDDLELKCIAILGIVHIVSVMFYFLSQTFLAHNSGSIFYFFLVIVLYCLTKSEIHRKNG